MRIIIGVKHYINWFLLVVIVGLVLPLKAEWQLDLSRRQKTLTKAVEASAENEGDKKAEENIGFFDFIASDGAPNEVVILNTEKGFVPSTVRLKVGARYQLHIVNINEKEKNVSFMLDAFSEHHGTFYGQVKSVTIEPKKEGVFSYQCPETAIEGKLVIFSAPGATVRKPAALW